MFQFDEKAVWNSMVSRSQRPERPEFMSGNVRILTWQTRQPQPWERLYAYFVTQFVLQVFPGNRFPIENMPSPGVYDVDATKHILTT